jgi:translation initiation factor IF-3
VAKGLKEIQIRPKIAEHDFQTKLRAVRRLLPKNEVKVQIFFRGRESTHPDIGLSLLRRIIEGTEDIATIKARNEKDNRFYVILVSNAKTL